MRRRGGCGRFLFFIAVIMALSNLTPLLAINRYVQTTTENPEDPNGKRQTYLSSLDFSLIKCTYPGFIKMDEKDLLLLANLGKAAPGQHPELTIYFEYLEYSDERVETDSYAGVDFRISDGGDGILVEYGHYKQIAPGIRVKRTEDSFILKLTVEEMKGLDPKFQPILQKIFEAAIQELQAQIKKRQDEAAMQEPLAAMQEPLPEAELQEKLAQIERLPIKKRQAQLETLKKRLDAAEQKTNLAALQQLQINKLKAQLQQLQKNKLKAQVEALATQVEALAAALPKVEKRLRNRRPLEERPMQRLQAKGNN